MLKKIVLDLETRSILRQGFGGLLYVELKNVIPEGGLVC